MAKIIINLVTFKDSCCVTAMHKIAFDASQHRIFAKLAAEAADYGLEFEVDRHGHGMRSYRVVDEANQADEVAAHEFMRDFNFWAHY